MPLQWQRESSPSRRGVADTKRTLSGWSGRWSAVLGDWVLGGLLTAIGLLVAVWVVAGLSTPDPTTLGYAGVTRPATAGDTLHILFKNGLVLALHALACVAGFMAGSSLPAMAEEHSGLWRRIHDHAGRLAILFVGLATLYSLATQAYLLGGLAGSLGSRPSSGSARLR